MLIFLPGRQDAEHSYFRRPGNQPQHHSYALSPPIIHPKCCNSAAVLTMQRIHYQTVSANTCSHTKHGTRIKPVCHHSFFLAELVANQIPRIVSLEVVGTNLFRGGQPTCSWTNQLVVGWCVSSARMRLRPSAAPLHVGHG
jgi:hypothetical protein